MLLTKQTKADYVVDTSEGPESLTFTVPGPTDPEFQRGKKKFLDSRIVQKGRRMVNRSIDARIDFFDKWCTRVDTLEEEKPDGSVVNIMDGDGWLAKVDVVMKCAVVAQHFEEKESLTAEDMEDLHPASDED